MTPLEARAFAARQELEKVIKEAKLKGYALRNAKESLDDLMFTIYEALQP